ncbi:MAG: phosphoribosyltransferase [Citrobacter freundii]|nr:MAG: phosphoribosyltransferase [Citrobacter freundii]
MFKNRIEAGLLLGARLKKYANKDGVVLAVPRGGVPVAYVVAKELGLPIDIVLTKKIGHPENKEYAIGAASLNDHFVVQGIYVSDEYIEEELSGIRKRLREMQRRFMGTNEPESIEGKTVIVIDDGIATGNTMLATVKLLRKSRPRKIVVAVPVASRTAIRKLSGEVDEIITVECPEHFPGVGSFYEDFSQVSDIDVTFYLNRLREMRQAG